MSQKPLSDAPPDTSSVNFPPRHSIKTTLPFLGAFFQRLTFSLGALLLIAYLVFWGLIMAEQAQAGALVDVGSTAGLAFAEAARYLGQRLVGPAETYTWQQAQLPASALVWLLLKRSAVLLLAAMAVATCGGVFMGLVAAGSRQGWVRTFLPLLSILTISLPSFLLGMILWIINFSLVRRFDMAVLPPTGYGLDAHLIMPALVLAARPLAQITRITYVIFSDVFQQDYIRTATAKGLSPRHILWQHAWRNGLPPILTTTISGLRLALSSLPVVEFFFVWPGLGLLLLRAIEEGNRHLTADLVLVLGLIFISGNLLLDMAYRVIDPRLAQPLSPPRRQKTATPWREQLRHWWGFVTGYGSRLKRDKANKPSVKPRQAAVLSAAEQAAERARRVYQRRVWLRATFTNVPLIVGTLWGVGFFFVAIFGQNLTPANPYQTSGVRYVQGELFAPPFPPTLPWPEGIFDLAGLNTYLHGLTKLEAFEYPWGSDPVGRDMLSLVLAGAKQTLALAFFATLARMALGVTLGILAGWGQGGRLDRSVGGLVEILQAFPTLLLAMVLILALDIRQGMPPFIIALAVVGWGEIMQLVRSRVISLRGMLFVESAVATGLNVPQIWVRHLLPNLLLTIIPVATLEMAGVLLLLAELGFLNIFMGGGAQAEVFVEAGKYHYADVPEWGALLSNVRDWWRSYPWMAWYPGLFFAGAIVTFNLLGEGLRHLLEQVGFGLGRLVNRYTLVFSGLLLLALVWTLRGAAPLGRYAPQVNSFQVENVMADVERLSSPEFSGREAGTPGGLAAAEYVAARMQEIGLQPAGNGDTYFQPLKQSAFHLTNLPELALVDNQGATVEPFAYRQDYVEIAAPYRTDGQAEAPVLVTLLGPLDSSGAAATYKVDKRQTAEHILLITSLADLDKIQGIPKQGALVVVDNPAWFNRRYLLTGRSGGSNQSYPILAIAPQVAERLLSQTGSSLEQLRQQALTLAAGEAITLPLVTRARLAVEGERVVEEFVNVIGFIPGGRAAEGLDDQAIIISANYDGLGIGPDGTFYPGANDNAGSVGTMLEIARAWRSGLYQPRKTIIFVAWAGGEQYQSFSAFEVMNAKIGFATALEVEAVIELSGVGAGAGQAVLIGEGSSYRLTQLLQNAAGRVGADTTIRGNYPHTGLYQLPPKGGQSALTALISWEGSDALAHTPLDTVDTLDPAKVEAVGRTIFLAATVIGREVRY